MILTTENYFTPDNNYISNSKLSDWIKDKNYFYKKHISNEIKQPVTDAMVIGSAVDEWLTGSRKSFEDKYMVVTRRSRRSDTPWRYQLTASTYDSIVSMCEKAEKHPAIQEMKHYTSQEIIYVEIPLGKFIGVCGIPDWYRLDEDFSTIVDLKTSQSIDPTKYHYKCMDLGYYRQQAFYQILLQNKFGVKDFISKHIVIEKDPDNINNVQTFILNQDRIEEEKDNIFEIFEQIKNEKDFAPRLVGWDDAIEIGEKYDS